MSRFQRVIRRRGQDEIRSTVQFERESETARRRGVFFRPAHRRAQSGQGACKLAYQYSAFQSLNAYRVDDCRA